MSDRRRIAQLERVAVMPGGTPGAKPARRRRARGDASRETPSHTPGDTPPDMPADTPSDAAVRAVIGEGRRRRDAGGGFGVTLARIRAQFDHEAMEGRSR
jgi:hypothetical protein